jgi:hypothetical protein
LKVSGNRALAAAYIDSRAVQDRLDDVLGVDGWQDDYRCLPDGSVVCRLRCRIGGEWLTKVDVGGPSHMDVELAMDRPPRDLHLILVGDVALLHGPAALGADLGQWRLVDLVDLPTRRWLAMALAAVGGPGLAAGLLRLGPGWLLRERGCLTLTGASSTCCRRRSTSVCSSAMRRSRSRQARQT